ncbi:MAG: VOC family protein [Sphingomonadales bacterium]
MLPTDCTVFQNAWVVPDLDTAMRHWVDVMKVGPFFVAEHKDSIVDVMHRGVAGALSMKVALAQAGPVQIELIEVLSEGPNCYRDIYAPGQGGFHHMCVWTHDIDADTAYYAGKGIAAATQGRLVGSIRFAYYDTFAALGGMIEVIEHTPEVEAMFGAVRDASIDWDGADPIRQFS